MSAMTARNVARHWMYTCVLIGALASVSCGDEAPTAPTEVESPVTVTWTTLLAPGGSASRTIVASQAGTVAVTLQSAALPVGLGIGVPQANGSGCKAAVTLTASPAASAQLSTTVEEGNYCVLVFDAVGVVDPLLFTVEIVHP